MSSVKENLHPVLGRVGDTAPVLVTDLHLDAGAASAAVARDTRDII